MDQELLINLRAKNKLPGRAVPDHVSARFVVIGYLLARGRKIGPHISYLKLARKLLKQKKARLDDDEAKKVVIEYAKRISACTPDIL